MASNNGSSPDPSHVAVAAGLGEQTPILAAILAQLRSETIEVGVSDGNRRELVLEQFPVAGCKRILAYRTGNGFDSLSVPTSGVLALTSNQARLGLTLVNSGASPIILYLASSQRTGSPAVWLAASGGSWDGRLGNVLWSGNVFAVGQGGSSTLVGGEI